MTTVLHLPQVRLRLDGSALSESDLAALSEVLIRQRLSRPALCELAFTDPPEALLRLEPGMPVQLDVTGAGELFAGELAEIEVQTGPGPERRLRLRCLDALQRLRNRRRLHAYPAATLANVGAEIVHEHGLGWSCPWSANWPHLVQHGLDDLAFVHQLAWRSGGTVTLRGSTVQLVPAEGLGSPIQLNWRPELGELCQVRRAAAPSVGAAGWDAGRAEAVQGDSGGSAEPLADRPLADAAAAEALARVRHARRVAQARHWSGTIRGDPRLLVGSPIRIIGAGAGLDGSGVLWEVEHRIDAVGGFRTWFTTLPDEREDGSDPMDVTLGTVTAVDDPAGSGRVRISLPACQGVDGGWLPVIATGAGSGKGLVALPAVGDRVAVLWLDLLRSQGLVLGGLWGAGGPPDAGIAGSAIRRWTLVTPGGHRLRLDDADGSLRIEDSGGSRLEMSPSGVRLRAQGELHLSAPGAPVVISGASIAFRSG